MTNHKSFIIANLVPHPNLHPTKTLIVHFNHNDLDQCQALQKQSEQVFAKNYLVYPTKVIINCNDAISQFFVDPNHQAISTTQPDLLTLNAIASSHWTFITTGFDPSELAFGDWIKLLTKWWQLINIITNENHCAHYQAKIIINKDYLQFHNHKFKIIIFWSDLFYQPDLLIIYNQLQWLINHQQDLICYLNTNENDPQYLDLIKQINYDRIAHPNHLYHQLVIKDDQINYDQGDQFQAQLITTTYQITIDPLTNACIINKINQSL